MSHHRLDHGPSLATSARSTKISSTVYRRSPAAASANHVNDESEETEAERGSAPALSLSPQPAAPDDFDKTVYKRKNLASVPEDIEPLTQDSDDGKSKRRRTIPGSLTVSNNKAQLQMELASARTDVKHLEKRNAEFTLEVHQLKEQHMVELQQLKEQHQLEMQRNRDESQQSKDQHQLEMQRSRDDLASAREELKRTQILLAKVQEQQSLQMQEAFTQILTRLDRAQEGQNLAQRAQIKQMNNSNIQQFLNGLRNTSNGLLALMPPETIEKIHEMKGDTTRIQREAHLSARRRHERSDRRTLEAEISRLQTHLNEAKEKYESAKVCLAQLQQGSDEHNRLTVQIEELQTEGTFLTAEQSELKRQMDSTSTTSTTTTSSSSTSANTSSIQSSPSTATAKPKATTSTK